MTNQTVVGTNWEKEQIDRNIATRKNSGTRQPQLTKFIARHQELALAHVFNEDPDMDNFSDDRWIFGGQENSVDEVISDRFETIPGDLSDKQYNNLIVARCKASKAMSFKELGREGHIDVKFGTHKIARVDYESCQLVNGTVRGPQLISKGTCTIPSHYRMENIAKFANVTMSQAAALSRCYQLIGADFKTVRKLNAIVRKHKVRRPWDIVITRSGKTLLDLAKAMKAIATADQEAPDWMHYDDGIFKFKILDDMAAHEIDELDLSEELDQLESKPGEYTYFNLSTIKRADHLVGKKNVSFNKIVTAIFDKKVSRENLPKLKKWVKRFTPAQKVKFRQAIQHAYLIA